MSITIPTRVNGTTIDASWFNTIKSALESIELVPENVTTTATLGASYNLAAVDASSGAVDLTLPSAINNEGRFYIVKAIDLTNAIRVLPDGSETIDGAASYSLNAANDCARFDCDGSNWHVTSSYGSVVGREVKNCSVTTPSRLDVKQDTNANLVTYAASAANGQLCFATDTKKMYQVLDGALTELGSGGGAGDADTISLIRAGALTNISEVDLTGNNAAFDGGGTITASSLSLSTTAGDLILADKVIKYSPAANGQNDYFGFTVAIPQGLRGRTIGLSFEYKNGSTCADNDFSFNVKLKDGAQAGYLYEDLLPAQYNSTNESIPFDNGYYVPSDCTEIEFGWQNEVTTTTVQLFLDNILVSSSPFVYKNMMDRQAVYISDAAQTSSGGAGDYLIKFNGTRASSGGGLFTIDNSGTYSKIVATQDCDIDLYSWMRSNTAGDAIWVEKNEDNVKLAVSNIAAGGGHTMPVTLNFHMSANDYLVIHATGYSTGISGAVLFVTATAESEHVVTPAKSGIENVYYDGYSTKDGSNNIKFLTARFNTASRVISVDNTTYTKYTALKKCLYFANSSINSNNAEEQRILHYNSAGTLQRTASMVAGSSLTQSMSLSGVMDAGDYLLVRLATAPDNDVNTNFGITAVDFEQQILSAIPTPKVCYLKDVKAYNVNGGSAVTGHQVRTLNTIEGDTSFCSLNGSNQFTLQPGSYDTESDAPVYHSGSLRFFHYLRDTSAGSTDAYEGKTAQGYLAQTVEVRPVLRMTFTLSAPKTFELKQYISNNPATTGLGVSHDLTGYNNIYSTVKITKVK